MTASTSLVYKLLVSNARLLITGGLFSMLCVPLVPVDVSIPSLTTTDQEKLSPMAKMLAESVWVVGAIWLPFWNQV